MGQLQQAVIILAENAIDAMPAGGTLGLRTQHESDEEGTSVVVEVSDTGQGIAEEIRERSSTRSSPPRRSGAAPG